MKQMDKKTLKKVHVWVRAVIQLLYFLFIPSAYTAAFNGVKYIFTQKNLCKNRIAHPQNRYDTGQTKKKMSQLHHLQSRKNKGQPDG